MHEAGTFAITKYKPEVTPVRKEINQPNVNIYYLFLLNFSYLYAYDIIYFNNYFVVKIIYLSFIPGKCKKSGRN